MVSNARSKGLDLVEDEIRSASWCGSLNAVGMGDVIDIFLVNAQTLRVLSDQAVLVCGVAAMPRGQRNACCFHHQMPCSQCVSQQTQATQVAHAILPFAEMTWERAR